MRIKSQVISFTHSQVVHIVPAIVADISVNVSSPLGSIVETKSSIIASITEVTTE